MRVFSNTQEGLEILCAICLIRSLVEIQTVIAVIIPTITAARAAVSGIAVGNAFVGIAMEIS